MGEGLVGVFLIISIILGIAWILVPFMIAGVNSRLDKVIKLLSQQAAGSGPAPAAVQSPDPEAEEETQLSEEEKQARAEKNKKDLLLGGLIVVIFIAIIVIAKQF